MALEREQRRLAAILAADVVGYSRLMGRDELGTLEGLKAHRRALIDPAIDAHGGRIVKTTGDGLLVEFPSAVDAVRCAVLWQRGMAERNGETPAEERIEFRIGINVGDVIVEADGDLYGDGVNIAARLEGIAEPGGISLSEDAWRQVRDRVKEAFVDRGETALKNIARPMRVYAIQPLSDSPLPQGGGGARGGGEAPGLAAPPPHPTSPPPGAERRSPSMAGAASAPPRLSIVVLPFANMSSDAEQEYFADGLTEDLATELSRVPGAFVIARNTAFTYKGKAADVKQIGRELGVRYALEGSVRKAGNRVRVNAQLIDAESGAHLEAMALRAMAVDPHDPWSRYALAFVRRLQYAFGESMVELEAAIRLNPNLAPAHNEIGFVKILLGRAQEGLPHFEKAMRLSPRDPRLFVFFIGIGLAHLMLGEDEAAIEALEKSRAFNAASSVTYQFLSAADLSP